MDIPSKQREYEELKQRVEQLERELGESLVPRWRPQGYYGAYYATSGVLLGLFAATAALLANVLGATFVGRHPLELIRVYLTFPLGESALQLADPARAAQSMSDGMILAFGCCLYLFTGMLLGIPLQLLLAKFTPQGPLWRRMALASAVSIGLWLVNFYLILSWLQPLLFGGNWIVDSKFLPWQVAAGTHLIFGLTMALLYPLGQYAPDRAPVEKP